MHTYLHTYTHTYVPKLIHTYIYTNIHTHIYIYIYPRTNVRNFTIHIFVNRKFRETLQFRQLRVKNMDVGFR